MKLTRQEENRIVDAIMDNLNENKVHLVFNDEVIDEDDIDKYFEVDVRYDVDILSRTEDDYYRGTGAEIIEYVDVYIKSITSDFCSIDADYDYIKHEVESRIKG